MGDIFLKLLNMSITAGWLILAVLCIRLLFRKIPKLQTLILKRKKGFLWLLHTKAPSPWGL